MRFLVDFKPPKGLWDEWGYVKAASLKEALRIAQEGYQSLFSECPTPEFRATKPRTFTVVASQRFTVDATSPEAAADKVKGTRISDRATFKVKEK
jgi:hypothetical protein